MKNIILFLSLMLALAACTKDKPSLAGKYAGTFRSSSPTSNSAPSNVTLNLTKDGYSGSSDASYPVICTGTWKQGGSTLHFEAGCNFLVPVPYLINGDYSYTLEGTRLRFSATRGDYTEIYDLKRVD